MDFLIALCLMILAILVGVNVFLSLFRKKKDEETENPTVPVPVNRSAIFTALFNIVFSGVVGAYVIVSYGNVFLGAILSLLTFIISMPILAIFLFLTSKNT